MPSPRLPLWLATHPDPTGRERRRFLLRLAALYATRELSLIHI